MYNLTIVEIENKYIIKLYDVYIIKMNNLRVLLKII